MDDAKAIAELVRRINHAWVEEQYDDLAQCFAPDMVLAMPGGMQRIEGRATIIESYRDFGRQSTLRQFDAEAPVLDVWEDTAVATSAFTIGYGYQGKDYTESGTDVLVFNRGEAGWCVVWRTVNLPGAG